MRQNTRSFSPAHSVSYLGGVCLLVRPGRCSLFEWSGPLIFRNGFRHRGPQMFDARSMCRVRGHEFRRPATPRFAHPFPKCNRLTGVILGTRHVNQTHLVGFGFMYTTEGEEDSILGTGSECGHDGVSLLRLQIAHREAGARHQRLRHAAAQQPLRAMPRDGMCHFVSHHRGKSCFGFGVGQNSGEDDDLAAGKTKCVCLRIPHHTHLPLKIPGIISCGLRETFRDFYDEFVLWSAGHHFRLRHDLAEALQA